MGIAPDGGKRFVTSRRKSSKVGSFECSSIFGHINAPPDIREVMLYEKPARNAGRRTAVVASPPLGGGHADQKSISSF